MYKCALDYNIISVFHFYSFIRIISFHFLHLFWYLFFPCILTIFFQPHLLTWESVNHSGLNRFEIFCAVIHHFSSLGPTIIWESLFSVVSLSSKKNKLPNSTSIRLQVLLDTNLDLGLTYDKNYLHSVPRSIQKYTSETEHRFRKHSIILISHLNPYIFNSFPCVVYILR